ncbi:MAG: cell surface protein [Planctomycetes bacterium]|nr:cell surface protein [Planctomycetota bacterium]
MMLSICAASFLRECRRGLNKLLRGEMMKNIKDIFLIVVFLSLTGLTPITTDCAGAVNYLSPQALVSSENENLLYIAQGGARQVAVFNTNSSKVIKTINLPAEPTGLDLSADGKYLYVTCAAPEGRVCVIRTETNKIIKRIPVGYDPRSPVLSPDGEVLYVCNRFNNTVSVINIKKNKQVAVIKVLREPFAADITPDGKWLYVGSHIPDGPANAESVACKVCVINTKTRDVDVTISLPNGSTGLRGLAVSPDGRYVYVSHILARYTVPTTQLERGWVNTNALSIIDAGSKKLFDTVLLDDVDNGAANPWGVSCTKDSKYVCVTQAGTHELSVIDTAALLDKIKNYQSSDTKAQGGAERQNKPGGYGSAISTSTGIPNELSFLYGIRRRIRLGGKGPRALAIVGSKVYVAEYFTDSMTLVDLTKWPRPETVALSLGPPPRMSEKRRGELLFNDASICFQKWHSCASCHPGQGRVDGLNWDLLNDGIGNPKNTKNLLLAHKTPPAMITGVRDSAEAAVRTGIKHIMFAVRPEEDALAIDEYLKSLKPVPSPYLAKGKLSKSAKRGQKVFEKAGCASCHKGPLYTDLQKYNVGIGQGRDEDREFDTPSLVEIWRTAPYLYDGRAANIEEVLTKYNTGDKHGVTSKLSKDEVSNLAEFVLSQ